MRRIVRVIHELSSSLFVGVGLAKGFKQRCKLPTSGLGFADLLHQVAQIDPEMRIRFTSPHPKDFPNEVLQVISSHRNICNHLHLPAQSGSTVVLERMARGYSREDYLSLVETIRSYLPNVGLTSDFISGFCGETEEDHEMTVDLVRKVCQVYGIDLSFIRSCFFLIKE